MKVWLDDERPAPVGWIHVRTADQAIEALINASIWGRQVEISLDHDLGDEANGTGYDVLLHIEREWHEFGICPPRYMHVHSANPPARKRMEAAIASIQRALDE